MKDSSLLSLLRMTRIPVILSALPCHPERSEGSFYNINEKQKQMKEREEYFRQWADEYLKSALETKKQLDLYKTKLQNCRSPSVAVSYEHKVMVLTDRYTRRELRRSGCRHNSTLFSPGCMNGSRKASRAESQYYEIYGE